MFAKPIVATCAVLGTLGLVAAGALIPAGASADDVAPLDPWTRITAGVSHTIALDPTGQVWTWGANGDGQLGDPTHERTAQPIALTALTGIVAVTAGEYHSAAVDSSGQVWAWGNNDHAQAGQPADPEEPDPVLEPVLVDGIADAVAVAAGDYFTLALTSTGEVWGWGRSYGSRLGIDSRPDSPAPVQVPLPITVTAIAAGGSSALALSADGEVWAWGSSMHAGHPAARVDGLESVTAITQGPSHALAVTTDGTLYAFGDNIYGQLGTDGPASYGTPVPVPGLPPVVGAAAGYEHSVALTASGEVYTWGRNYSGELGDGSGVESRTTPQRVPGLSDIVALAPAIWNTSFAVDAAGLLHSWGANDSGQLGDLSDGALTSPVSVPGLSNITQIAAGYAFSMALTADGALYTWGRSPIGAYGNIPEAPTPTPVQFPLSEPVDDIAVGYGHVIALGRSGTVYTWGRTEAGQTGQGSWSYNFHTPAAVAIPGAGADPVVAVAAGDYSSAALTLSGAVYAWGSNDNGALNVGTVGRVTAPAEVLGLPTQDPITAIDAGQNHMVAVTASGKVYVWGLGAAASLGRPDNNGPNNPPTGQFYPPTEVTQVPDAVASVAAGGRHTFAVTQSGVLYVWGAAAGTGSLGASEADPVRVPVALDLPEPVIGAATMEIQSVVVTASGAVYGAGFNDRGTLGTGDDLVVSTFTLVAEAADVAALAHSELTTLALTRSGLLYAWGDSWFFQTGAAPPNWVPAQRPAGFAVVPARQPEPSPSTTEPEPGNQTPTGTDTGTPTGTGTPTDSRTPTDTPTDTRTPASPPTPPGPSPAPEPTPPSDAPPGPPLPDDAGTARPPDGAPADPPAVNAPPPRLSRFATSFTTVVVKAGAKVKLPVVTYRAAGTTAGKTKVTWTASSPKVATVAKGKKTGKLSVTAGSTPRLTIRAAKAGTSRIVLTSPGARRYVMTVKAVPAPKLTKVTKVRITAKQPGANAMPGTNAAIAARGAAGANVAAAAAGAAGAAQPSAGKAVQASAGKTSVLRPGQNLQLKARLTPVHASRVSATWKTSNPSVARVNAAGRVTAVAPGKTTITCAVGGKTVHKAIRVNRSRN
ncbi:MAG: Ig-like domain-containing protein [Bifidobacteriaceae bacterium]|jgi:alpha-tubulin suppressor-like RCC1 family protein|nr:Ig-like domain-containing protein [Bifidobacteriaceae bacterium]